MDIGSDIANLETLIRAGWQARDTILHTSELTPLIAQLEAQLHAMEELLDRIRNGAE